VQLIRRQFSRDFKMEAIRQVKEHEVSVVPAGRDLTRRHERYFDP
jgi:transposase-like protein